MTRREFAFYAQKRSGHHAIVNWLRFQLTRSHLFLNSCEVGRGVLESCHLSQSRLGWGKRDIRGPGFLKRVLAKTRWPRTILYNYEDQLPPDDIPEQGPFGGRLSALLVLRDPYNLLASRLRWERTHRAQFGDVTDEVLGERLAAAVAKWLDYARASDRPEVELVNYVSWFVSDEYRAELAGRLGLAGREARMDEVASWGPGSSFDGVGVDDARKLKVLDRWREFAEDPIYRGAALGAELAETAARFFPDLAAVEWAAG